MDNAFGQSVDLRLLSLSVLSSAAHCKYAGHLYSKLWRKSPENRTLRGRCIYVVQH